MVILNKEDQSDAYFLGQVAPEIKLERDVEMSSSSTYALEPMADELIANDGIVDGDLNFDGLSSQEERMIQQLHDRQQALDKEQRIVERLLNLCGNNEDDLILDPTGLYNRTRDIGLDPTGVYKITRELDQLLLAGNNMPTISELPPGAKPSEATEEIQNLAARINQLKSAELHEANKIILHGIKKENERLRAGLAQMESTLVAKAYAKVQEAFFREMVSIYKTMPRVQVANNSIDSVTKVLDNVKAGVTNGGIDKL